MTTLSIPLVVVFDPSGKAVKPVSEIRSESCRSRTATSAKLTYRLARFSILFMLLARPTIGLALEMTSTSKINPLYVATDPRLHEYVKSYFIQLTSFPPSMPPPENGQKYVNYLFISGPGTIVRNRIGENALARMPSNAAAALKNLATPDNICSITRAQVGDEPDRMEMIIAVNNSDASGSLDAERRCFLRSMVMFEHLDLNSLSGLSVPQLAIETFKTAWGLK